ncbi:putative dual specificity protein phosphatase DSP8 isoform X2 [Papaver somniferum]|uniref:putative dual specificity protein phosphatase DSP8 isoform X2 n=1 Tax=Papaver somniferum TaxID=3469 RepID=UPI000E70236F|nr:putative dual specificity protein phosphatase DSP8 isoform X2 [Papaver somniferum]
MKIKQLDDEEEEYASKRMIVLVDAKRAIVGVDAKRVLVGAGARVLFYPTLLYNVFRNKLESEFHWWDKIDQSYKMDHLVIPTRDYLFAPSFVDISRAVDFIHETASCGKVTYVHCKAGRGRSTTIVLCYLVHYKQMTPSAAFEYVRFRRPRVLLAPSQWKAVQDYQRYRLDIARMSSSGDGVLITKADLEGYHNSCDDSKKQLSVVGKPKKGKPMIARLSCLFAALKVSAGSSTVTGRLPELRAC